MDRAAGSANERRLEDELEQLRVALDDAQAEAAALAAERDGMRAELGRRGARIHELEARLETQGRTSAATSDRLRQQLEAAQGSATEEELRVAMEEMQVLAEELEEANQALTRANGELEARVTARTAELAALNARLRDSEERLRIAQRYAGAGTWDWDIRADRVTWSEEYFDLYGLDPKSVTPSHATWLEAIHPGDRAAADAALQDCLRRRDPDFRVEYRIRHPRRGERWLAGRGRLVCDAAGDPLRLVGLNIDITDRKRAELRVAEANEGLRREVEEEVKAREAAQARLFQTLKLEALGQLTGGVAHDFNNLLSVIMSGAALLRRHPEPGRAERLMDAIEQAARRGADLTRRLLTFARRQALRPEPLDLRAWMEELRELLARALRGDITIEILAPEGLWPVLADAGELELAVLNLAVNARDAMPRGGVLRLSAANAELDPLTDPDGLGGEFVRLEVEDSGDGMPPEVLGRVFEPFFSTKEVGRGTGLGLAQVYGFARQSGGAARIASRPGRGTTVSLLLPRSAAMADAPVPTPAEGSATEHGEASPLRVLLVEDDDDVAGLTAEMLRHLGHEVSRVASGPAALKAIEAGTPADLVFTDVVMPGGQDGLDVALRLKAERPALPVLVCSGYGGAPARVASAGMALLRKPFTLRELGRAITTALETAARSGT
jgi:PAS domain S-box-containing protein